MREILSRAKREPITEKEALKLFKITSKEDLEKLFETAFEVREANAGSRVLLTSTIHISNICPLRCKYCGFKAGASKEGYYKPFVKSRDDVLRAAKIIEESGIPRVSCSAAHGWGKYTIEMANLIKEHTSLLVLINVGADLNEEALEVCRADTICCNLECTNEKIFSELKPDERLKDRIRICELISEFGFELSSGLLIGVGESYEDRVKHLFFLRRFPTLGEIPIMGFQPYKGTPMENYPPCSEVEQAKTIAIARLIYQDLRITAPSPCISPKLALLAGANNIATVIPENYPLEVKGVARPRYSRLGEVKGVIKELGLRVGVV